VRYVPNVVKEEYISVWHPCNDLMDMLGHILNCCIISGCVLFQNLTNLDRSERNAPRSQSNLTCSDTSVKIWLSHAYLCCRAPALPLYL